MATATDEIVALPIVPTDEEVAIRNAVRGICESFGGPDYHRRIVEADEPPTELWNALAEKGYLGVNLPERYGGGGLGMHALQAVGEEISAAGCSLLLIVVSPAIVGSILTRHGTEAQREEWLPAIAAGTTKVAFAITEPDAGTNSHNLSTTATRDGDKYILKGQKTYISGVEDADAILVIARKREDDGSLGLPLLDARGRRLAGAREAVHPGRRQGLRQAVAALLRRGRGARPTAWSASPRRRDSRPRSTGSTPSGSWAPRSRTASDAGRSELASAYANERKVWGDTPIGAHQGLSHPLAQAKIELELARLMTQKAAALYDAGAPAGEPANMAKYAAAEAAIKCVDQTIQVHGGNGFALEYGLTDMYWGARLARTAPVSREMILNYVAEHSLGLPRSY